MVIRAFMFIAAASLVFPFTSCHYNRKDNSSKVIYETSMATSESMKGWVMEGPGKVEFRDGWMEMYSPNKEMHHVYWCPVDLPDRFESEWDARNVESDGEGLCMIIFAAKGKQGQDIFDPSMPPRKGGFNEYTKGEMNSYHISYYANNKWSPNRETSNLRKNAGSHMMTKGPIGIEPDSGDVHHVRLVKDGAHILFTIDGKTIIDWTDDGVKRGPVYKDGKIGFRQMQETHFAYRNFKVHALNN